MHKIGSHSALSALTVAMLVFAWSGCSDPVTQLVPDADIAFVENELNKQVDAWNRGDIEAFMEFYIKADSLRFASGNTIRNGWESTIERYRTTYPDVSHMGVLRFDILEKTKLSPEWITIFGRFHLTREEEIGDLEGLFTLIIRKYPDGWKIVADHTSV